jgi:hypothetical protein
MTWHWDRCKICRREVRANDVQWDPVAKVIACRECRERLRQRRKAKR